MRRVNNTGNDGSTLFIGVIYVIHMTAAAAWMIYVLYGAADRVRTPSRLGSRGSRDLSRLALRHGFDGTGILGHQSVTIRTADRDHASQRIYQSIGLLSAPQTASQ
jgi:RimJ/RimL family protein N-acetyltransferase